MKKLSEVELLRLARCADRGDKQAQGRLNDVCRKSRLSRVSRTGVYPYCTSMRCAWRLIEERTAHGACPALINDDNAHWTVSADGIQNAVTGDKTRDVQTTFFVEAKCWFKSPMVAIVYFYLKDRDAG